MNKYRYINDGKKELIELSFNDDLNLKLKLNLKETPLKEEEKIFCRKCNAYKRWSLEEEQIKCSDCRTGIEWSLQGSYWNDKDTHIKFKALEKILSTDFRRNISKEDFEKFTPSLDLLTESQKEIVINYLIRNSILLRIELQKSNENINSVLFKLSTIDKSINDISSKINNGIEPIKSELKKEVESLKDKFKNEVLLEVKEELKENLESDVSNNFIEKNKLNLDNYLNDNFDIEKIKRTLNIMMELFSKGMDFHGILLRAKVNLDTNIHNSNLMLNSNYELSNDNNGDYMSDNIENCANSIFKKFEGV